MKNELLRFKSEANRRGVCEEYGGKWDEAENKDDLFNIALSAQGIEYIAAAVADGWGLSIDYFKDEFGSYINGAKKRDENGYTSSLYVDFNGTIEQRTTLLLIVSCKCTINIEEFHACEIYVCGNSDVNIVNKGYCAAYVFGGESNVSSTGNDIHLKTFHQ